MYLHSAPINITSVNQVSRTISFNVVSAPQGAYEIQYSTDGTTWNLACANGIPRIGLPILSELNDVPVDLSFYNVGDTVELQLNANYFAGLVDNVATYVSVPSNLSGVRFRAVLSDTNTWSNTGAFNKPTPLSPIVVISNVLNVV
jgi:hypothetical protein